MDYLTWQNEVVSGKRSANPVNAKGKRVVVIGGGDTGSDCIGTAIRQGALSVHQLELLGKPPMTRGPENPWPEWPLQLRTSHAHGEGAERHWQVQTQRFVGEDGNVAALDLINLSTSEPMTLAADIVILAIGFTGVAPDIFASYPDLNVSASGAIATDGQGLTSIPGVFAAGDSKRGASLIVWAIAEGRKVAEAVDRYCQQEKVQIRAMARLNQELTT
jgi:glutamate synthase (NADPH/NADH) small chain